MNPISVLNLLMKDYNQFRIHGLWFIKFKTLRDNRNKKSRQLDLLWERNVLTLSYVKKLSYPPPLWVTNKKWSIFTNYIWKSSFWILRQLEYFRTPSKKSSLCSSVLSNGILYEVLYVILLTNIQCLDTEIRILSTRNSIFDKTRITCIFS